MAFSKGQWPRSVVGCRTSKANCLFSNLLLKRYFNPPGATSVGRRWDNKNTQVHVRCRCFNGVEIYTIILICANSNQMVVNCKGDTTNNVHYAPNATSDTRSSRSLWPRARFVGAVFLPNILSMVLLHLVPGLGSTPSLKYPRIIL